MSEKLVPTPWQQRIYNRWLSVTKTQAKKPYRRRKRWDNLPSGQVLSLIRLESFFKRNQNIDIDEFFQAPFVVYHDWRDQHDQYTNFPLSFYTKYKAISIYKMVRNNK